MVGAWGDPAEAHTTGERERERGEGWGERGPDERIKCEREGERESVWRSRGMWGERRVTVRLWEQSGANKG